MQTRESDGDKPRLRILIVDDKDYNLEMLRLNLSLHDDFEVIGEAAGGNQAVAMAAELQPDVVLMDYRMPDMDGMAATRAIKRAAPAQAVIIVTLEPEVVRCLPHSDLGPDAVCGKLEAPTELPGLIRRYARR